MKVDVLWVLLALCLAGSLYIIGLSVGRCAEPEPTPAAPFGSLMPAESPAPIGRTAETFAAKNPLVSVKTLGFGLVNDRYVELLMLVEGTSGDRAIISYFLKRQQTIDTFPPFLPLEGETWRIGTFEWKGNTYLRLEYQWTGQDAEGVSGALPPAPDGEVSPGP